MHHIHTVPRVWGVCVCVCFVWVDIKIFHHNKMCIQALYTQAVSCAHELYFLFCISLKALLERSPTNVFRFRFAPLKLNISYLTLILTLTVIISLTLLTLLKLLNPIISPSDCVWCWMVNFSSSALPGFHRNLVNNCGKFCFKILSDSHHRV